MLTFSVVGNWMLGPQVLRSSDSGDFATRSGLLKDSANRTRGQESLPGVEDASPVFLDQVYDELVPLPEPGSHHIDNILAEAGLLAEPAALEQEVPEELSVATAHGPVHTAEAVEGIGLVPIQPEPSLEPTPERHSFQEATYQRTQKATKASNWRDQGQYHLTHAGGPGHGRTLNKAKKRFEGSDIVLHTDMIPVAKNRIMVRFSLDLPQDGHDLDKILNHLPADRRAMEQRLAARSQSLLQSLEEVLDEEPSEEEELERQKRAQLQRMKSKLSAHLQQRPGGLELIAELSPAQLEALLKKLSARNPRLRALMQG